MVRGGVRGFDARSVALSESPGSDPLLLNIINISWTWPAREMLAAATSLFSRSQIYQSYAINATPSSTPSPPGSSLPAATLIKPFQVGLWKVQTGYHKVLALARDNSFAEIRLDNKQASIRLVSRQEKPRCRPSPSCRQRAGIVCSQGRGTHIY
jgi:hypothetical protein